MSYIVQLNGEYGAMVDLLREDFDDYLLMDERESYVDFGSDSSIDNLIGGSEWAIDGWVRFDGFGRLSSEATVFDKGAVRVIFNRDRLDQYSLLLIIEFDGAGTDYMFGKATIDELPALGEWFHFLFQGDDINGGSGQVEGAIDGVWNDYTWTVYTGTYADATYSLYYGNNQDLDRPFSGGVAWIRYSSDRVYTYLTPFTPPAVDSPPSPTGTTELLAITEGTGTTTDDLSSNNNVGTIHDAYWSGEEGYCHLEDGGLNIGDVTKKSRMSGSLGIYGSNVYDSDYNNRSVDGVFEIWGDSKEKIIKMKGRINRLLSGQHDSNLIGPSKKPTLRYQVDGMDDYVYFRIVDGECYLPEEFMSLESQAWEKDGGYTVKGCRLDLTCSPFAAGEMVKIIDGGVIGNTEDDFNDNYLEYEAVGGDTWGPAVVNFYDHNMTAAKINKVWYSIIDYGRPDILLLTYEGEDIGIGGSNGSQDVIYSGYTDASGGYEYEITTSVTAETLLAEIDPPFTSGIRLGDVPRYFRVVVVGDFEGPATYRIATYNSISADPRTYYPGIYVADGAGFYHLDFGVINICPAGTLFGEMFRPMDIELYIECDDTSGVGSDIDRVVLLPVVDHKHKVLGSDGTKETISVSASGASFFDDAINQRTAIISRDNQDDIIDSTVTVDRFDRGLTSYGSGLYLTPNSAGRLVAIAARYMGNDYPGGLYANCETHVDMWYEPRYIDIGQ